MRFFSNFLKDRQRRHRTGQILLFLSWLGFILAAGLSEPRTVFFQGYLQNGYAVAACVATVVLLITVAILHRWRLRVPAIVAIFAALPLLWISALPVIMGSLLFLTAAVLTLVARKAGKRLARIGESLNAVGLVALSLFGIDRLYDLVGDVIRLESATAFGARMLPDSLIGASASSVVLAAEGRSLPVALGFDKLGGVMFAALLAFYLLTALFYRHGVGQMARSMAAALGYAWIAGIFALATTSGKDELNIYEELPILWRFLPMVLLLSIWASGRYGRSAPRPRMTLRWHAACALLAVSALLFLVIPSGEQKQGAVLIDEHFSKWEPTDVPFSTDVYGSMSVYNYGNLTQELASHYEVKTLEREIEDADLANASVVILKTPTRPYPEAFCRRIEKFVARGGGVWLISDHTDAFGMSTYLNTIATRFGCSFEKNAWMEPPYKRNLWTATEFTEPYLQGIEDFLFYTGCQINVPPSFKKVAIARRQMFEDADYSAGSFFGKLRFVPENTGGNAVMAAAGPVGNGRVSLWSDSTLFSNFSIYMPGKLLVALNTVKWLQHGTKDALAAWRIPIAAICLVAAFLIVGAGRTWLLVCVAAAYAPLLVQFAQRDVKWFKKDDLRGGREVLVYEPARSPHFPIYFSIDEPGDYYYQTAFVAVQRAGGRPILVSNPHEFRDSRVCLWIPNPAEDQYLKPMAEWVRRGGHLIMLDGAKVGHDFLRQALGEIGGGKIKLETLHQPTWAEVKDSAGRDLGETLVAGYLKGGSSAVVDGSNRSVAQVFKCGKGSVYVTTTTNLFSDNSLGNVHAVPTRNQRAILEQLYDGLADRLEPQKTKGSHVRLK